MNKHRRKLGLVAIFASFMLLGSLLPPNQYGSAAVTQVVVSGSGTYVNVRSGPGTSYQIVEKALKGNDFRVLGQEGDWYKIQLKNGKEGWIAGWLVKTQSTPKPKPESSPVKVSAPAPSASERVVEVTSNTLNVRSGPGTSFNKVTNVTKGTKLTVVKTDKDWLQVRVSNGKTGWIAAWLVKEISKPTLSSPPKATESQRTATITSTTVNLRTGPGTNHGIAGKATKGQSFNIVSVKGDWIQIQFGKQKAWVAGWLVKVKESVKITVPSPSPETKPEASGPTAQPIVSQDKLKAKVNASSVNLRGGPGTTHSIVGSAAKGDTYQVIKSEKDWIQIRLKSGQAAWIAGWLVNTFTEKVVVAPPSTPSNDPTTPAPNPTLPALDQTTKPQPSDPKPDFAVNRPGVTEEVVITGKYVNVRNGPGTNYTKLGTVDQGERFPYLGEQGDWVKFSYKGKEAWLAGWLIKREVLTEAKPNDPVASPVTSPGVDPSPAPETPTEAGPEVKIGKIIGSSVNLRSEPNSEQFITTLTMGMEVELLEHKDDWVKVKTDSGQEGWVVAWLVDIQEGLNPVAVSFIPEMAQISLKGEREIVFSLKEETADSVVYELSGVQIPADQKEILVQQAGINKIAFVENTSSVLMIISLTSQLKAQYVSEQNGSQINITFSALDKPLSGKIIAVDAGHGGLDPGAVGKNGLQEKVVVWDVTLKVKDQLEALGATVILTRRDDTKVPLVTRAEIANQAKADIFVSVHANANTNPAIRGTSTYYYAPAGDAKLSVQRSQRAGLAQKVQDAMVKAVGLRDIGILEGNFSVLRNTAMPSILVELAFLSNAEEEKLLAKEDIRLKFSEAIVEGITNYFK